MEKNKPSLLKSIGMLSILMVLSKALSLVRELTIASFYGTTASTDAYFLASGFVTNVFFGITAALSTVFLPYYIECKKNNKDNVSKICSSIISSLSFFSIIVVILIYFISPLIIRMIAPSYEGAVFAEAVLYMRIYSVSILFSLLTNLLTAMLNAESSYSFAAVASVIYSITSITCMIALRKFIGVAALAVSVPLSFLIQLIILLIKTKKYFRFRPTTALFHPAVKRLLILMFPVLLGNATVEINQLVTRSFAAGIGEGSVSVLTYANTLFSFVSSILQTTVITIFFTELSTAAKNNDDAQFNALLEKAIHILILLVTPISVITCAFSKDVVKIAYGHGAFGDDAVLATAACLSVYAVVFVFDGIRNLFVRAFYAKNNTRTPLVNSVISLCITLLLSYFLSKYIGVSGIVVAISISICACTLFLVITAKKQLCTIHFKKMLPTLIKVLLSALVMIVALWLLNRFLGGQNAYIRFITVTAVGMVVYFVMLLALKCDTVMEIANMVKEKLFHKNQKIEDKR